MDLTGDYESQAVKGFTARGYKVHGVQHRKVKQFISSYGQKAKTGKIAKMLTMYGGTYL
jgi:transposase